MNSACVQPEDDPCPPSLPEPGRSFPFRRTAGSLLVVVAAFTGVVAFVYRSTPAHRPPVEMLRCVGAATAISDWVAASVDVRTLQARSVDGPVTVDVPGSVTGDAPVFDGRALAGRVRFAGQDLFWTVDLVDTSGNPARGAVLCTSTGR